MLRLKLGMMQLKKGSDNDLIFSCLRNGQSVRVRRRIRVEFTRELKLF